MISPASKAEIAGQPDHTTRSSNQAIRIALTKSVTEKHKEDYEKTIVTVESELPSGITVPEGLRTLETSIDEFLSKPAASASDHASNLDAIEWQAFRSGRKGGWTYSDRPEASELVKRLKAAKDKKLTEDGWHYRLSGDDDRFLE
jgi:hypothetical protein